MVVLGVGVVSWLNDSVDPKKNSETGLVDGNYGMNPDSYITLNDRCSFTGDAIDVASNATAKTDVTVVGEGAKECGIGSGTPDAVLFTVTGGVARIVQVS